MERLLLLAEEGKNSKVLSKRILLFFGDNSLCGEYCSQEWNTTAPIVT